MKSIPEVDAFVNGVLNGDIASCEYIKLCVRRYVSDIDNAKKNGYYHSYDAAMYAIDFIGSTKHTKGKQWYGTPFNIQTYQYFFIWNVFGWLMKDTNARRFLKAYLETAKKSGKSEFAAAVLILMTFMDGEVGAQSYAAATKTEQAMNVFRPAKTMVKQLRQDSKYFSNLVKFNSKRIFSDELEAYIEPLSSDHERQDGMDAHCGIIDEYHAHKTSDLAENLENSMVGRSAPLTLITTTAGFSIDSPCYKFRKVCIDIMRKTIQNERIFAMIFSLDEKDDWRVEENWIKSNPNIGNTPTWDNMRQQFTQAVTQGYEKRVQFQTKNLNVWTSSLSGWIAYEDWMKNVMKIDLSKLKGRKCNAGLDLAEVKDFNAFVLVFPAERPEDRHIVVPFFWCPEATAKKRTEVDFVNYMDWADRGLITLTKRRSTHYAAITEGILEAIDKIGCVVEKIYYDKFNANSVVDRLEEEGYVLEVMSQLPSQMSAPTKEIERCILNEEIQYDHEVLTWMCGNVEIRRTPDGDIKMDKKKSADKIDGMVAMAMAFNGIVRKPENESSKYEKEGLFVI